MLNLMLYITHACDYHDPNFCPICISYSISVLFAHLEDVFISMSKVLEQENLTLN